MNGERFTGVTLQTLDSQSFDHGTILVQTPYPGLQIGGYRKIKYADLLDLITPIAADMLVKGIRDRVFVPPLPQLALPSLPDKLIHARKIRTEDREVDWRSWDAVAIERRYRALGPLWNTILLDDKTPVRIKFEDFELVEKPAISNEWYTQQQQKRTTQCENREKDEEDSKKVDMSEVKFMVYLTKTGHKLPLLFIKDGEAIIILARRMALRVSQITAAGMGKRAASMAAEGLRGDKTWRVVPGTRKSCQSRSCVELIRPERHTSDEHMQQNRAEQFDFAQNPMNRVEKLE
jgi:methionyl-tRNA formyltransferase